MAQQHILIVLNDGVFQGASITDDKGDPRPLDDLAALATVVPSLNVAFLAERDAALAKLAEIESELADPEVTIKKVRDAHERTEKQRERAKLQAEKLELETKTAQVVAALDLLKDAKNK